MARTRQTSRKSTSPIPPPTLKRKPRTKTRSIFDETPDDASDDGSDDLFASKSTRTRSSVRSKSNSKGSINPVKSKKKPIYPVKSASASTSTSTSAITSASSNASLGSSKKKSTRQPQQKQQKQRKQRKQQQKPVSGGIGKKVPPPPRRSTGAPVVTQAPPPARSSPPPTMTKKKRKKKGSKVRMAPAAKLGSEPRTARMSKSKSNKSRVKGMGTGKGAPIVRDNEVFYDAMSSESERTDVSVGNALDSTATATTTTTTTASASASGVATRTESEVVVGQGTTTITMDLTSAVPAATSTLSVAVGGAGGGGGRATTLDFVIKSQSVEIIPWDELTVLSRLGSGGQAEVWHAEWRFTDTAVKIVDGVTNEAQIKMLLEEVAVLCNLRHTNTLLILGVCSEPAQGKVAIVTEYMAGGDLHNKIHCAGRDKAAAVPLSSKLDILFGAVRGLHFLHMTPSVAVHRDIKPSNILLSETGAAKLADFGIAGHSVAAAGMCTHRYASPQVLMGKSATQADDVYSMGLVMVELLSDGVRPFSELPDARDRVAANVFAAPFSGPNAEPLAFLAPALPALCALINKCFHDPESRPSTEDLLVALRDARAVAKAPGFVDPVSPIMAARRASSYAPPVSLPAAPPYALAPSANANANANARIYANVAGHLQSPSYNSVQDIAPPESSYSQTQTYVLPPQPQQMQMPQQLHLPQQMQQPQKMMQPMQTSLSKQAAYIPQTKVQQLVTPDYDDIFTSETVTLPRS